MAVRAFWVSGGRRISGNRQHGFGLFGALLASVVLAIGMAITMQIQYKKAQSEHLESAIKQQALQVSRYQRAVKEYVDANSGSWPNNSRVIVSTSDLISNGYLPAGFRDITPLNTRLQAIAYKDGTGTTRFIIADIGDISEATLAQFGIEARAAAIERLKERVAEKYVGENLIAGYTATGSATAFGINREFAKDLSSYLIPPPSQSSAIAFEGFEDLQGVEHQQQQTALIKLPSLNDNTVHGSITWNAPGYYTWTLPHDGVVVLDVEAAGGAGGLGLANGGWVVGGKGAVVRGRVSATKGDVFKFSIGSRGWNGSVALCSGGGGGGRTSLMKNNELIAVAAAGGGGSCTIAGYYAFCLRRYEGIPGGDAADILAPGSTPPGANGANGYMVPTWQPAPWVKVGAAGGGFSLSSFLGGGDGASGGEPYPGGSPKSYGGGGGGPGYSGYGAIGGGGGGWYGGAQPLPVASRELICQSDMGYDVGSGGPGLYYLNGSNGGFSYIGEIWKTQISPTNTGNGYVRLTW